MNQRELFHLAPFRGDQPLVEHPFYQWLLDHETEGRRQQVGIKEYLAELGFNLTQHRLDEAQLKTLQYAETVYQDLWMPTREPQALNDLFTQVLGINPKGFWLRGTAADYPVQPTPKLVDLIDKAAPIYPLHPDHYYFEVIRSALIIKYQSIIGSRRLCVIKEGSPCA